MATLRPAVNDGDDYLKKIVKYIPAEIITGYAALAGFLSVTNDMQIPAHYKSYYLIMLALLAVVTPIWTYFSVIDAPSPPANPKKYAIFHSVIALIAFLIWVYASGNLILKAVLCKCDTPSCDCGVYSTVLGSVVLLAFTIITPLLERIFLGNPLPLGINNQQTID